MKRHYNSTLHAVEVLIFSYASLRDDVIASAIDFLTAACAMT